MLKPLDQADFSTLLSEVCILGAGPAGITLALELAEKGVDVVLLEGGGMAPPEPEGLDLYRGEVSGRQYPLRASRLRYFGGTSGHWGGWCRPLDEVDFAAKPNVEFSGWPITRTQLLPWYGAAHRWLQIDSDEYFTDKPAPFGNALLPETAGVTNRYFRFSPPTRFGAEYQQAISDSKQITCLLGANAAGIERNESGEITAVTARSLSGKTLEVRASATVLAMGGIENARFLLNSEQGGGPAIGNHSDWLGRSFMDHSGWSPGALIAPTGLKYDRFSHEGSPVMPVLSIEDKLLLERDLINCCGRLLPMAFADDIESTYFQNAWFSGSKLLEKVDTYRLQLIFEPSPCRDSRVTLSDDRDAIGLRRTHLHWAFNQADFARLKRSIELFSNYFGVTGLGRLKLTKPVNQQNSTGRIGNGWHHMGTTRMSAQAASGVVDENCRVHDTQNLYVAGSSVFPSVGFSNPTLTIVALACRLAQHLRGVLSAS